MNRKILIIVLLSVALAAAITSVCLIVFKKETVLLPDYAPPALEENAEKIEGESGDKMEVSEGGGGVNLIYKDQVVIDLSEEKITSMHFVNPGKSYNNMVIQVVVKGEVVAQSGTLAPGYRLNTLNLLKGAAGKLRAGAYAEDTKFVIAFYDPDTSEKAILQNEIPITVVVQE